MVSHQLRRGYNWRIMSLSQEINFADVKGKAKAGYDANQAENIFNFVRFVQSNL